MGLRTEPVGRLGSGWYLCAKRERTERGTWLREVVRAEGDREYWFDYANGVASSSSSSIYWSS